MVEAHLLVYDFSNFIFQKYKFLLMVKGIALSTIVYFILAIVTITLILGLLSNKIYPSAKSAYCSVFLGLRNLLPLPSSMKTDVPIYCKRDTTVYIETVEIESTNPDRIALNIASYALACWEKTGKLNLGQNKICYELVIKGVDGEVNESMVRSILSNDAGILSWKAGTITAAKSIGISYNSTTKLIEVS